MQNHQDQAVAGTGLQGLKVRWMGPKDVSAVALLDNEVWGEAEAWGEKAVRMACQRKEMVFLLAEHFRVGLAGYLAYFPHEHHFELFRVGVKEECRRQRVGLALIGRLESRLSSTRRTHLSCQISEWALEGQLFLKGCGFRMVGTNKSHEEDRYRFELRLK